MRLEDVFEATTGFPVFQHDFWIANPSTDSDIVLDGILVNSFPPLLYLKLHQTFSSNHTLNWYELQKKKRAKAPVSKVGTLPVYIQDTTEESMNCIGGGGGGRGSNTGHLMLGMCPSYPKNEGGGGKL